MFPSSLVVAHCLYIHIGYILGFKSNATYIHELKSARSVKLNNEVLHIDNQTQKHEYGRLTVAYLWGGGALSHAPFGKKTFHHRKNWKTWFVPLSLREHFLKS